ncbi:hypothetical protein GGE65_006985 [Skermanella aerolata]|jgi:hypothetical protein|uniref:Aldolase n=1 Tax=Skermanella aerolata TaxID=393310 RepID=A0A512E3P0_9PROT|nr:DUF1476 domain-containing protein [Skermanella aerolata]KJB93803.1 hypothetical protein N826_12920 [Skermanella aerolata KACC 11604]GEO43070.1 hypothetical protein SAE02_72180 [Skermanella aerolata]
MPASYDRSTIPAPEAACPFEATEGYVVARRNLLIGLWAGRRLGLSGTELETYAREIVAADRDEPGHEDVLRKLRADFKEAGCPISEPELSAQVVSCHAEASRQCAATD